MRLVGVWAGLGAGTVTGADVTGARGGRVSRVKQKRGRVAVRVRADVALLISFHRLTMMMR